MAARQEDQPVFINTGELPAPLTLLSFLNVLLIISIFIKKKIGFSV
jgi:hypothetical protein